MYYLAPHFSKGLIAGLWITTSVIIFLRVLLSAMPEFRYRWDWSYGVAPDHVEPEDLEAYERKIKRKNSIYLTIAYIGILFLGLSIAHVGVVTLERTELYVIDILHFVFLFFPAATMALFLALDIANKTIYWMFRTSQAICVIGIIWSFRFQDWIGIAFLVAIIIAIQVLVKIISKYLKKKEEENELMERRMEMMSKW